MKKIELLKKIKKDLINKTSYSIDYLADLSVDKTVSEKGIKIRKIFSPLLRFLYSSQSKYKLIKEKKSGKIQSKNGKIFVVNHRQADDIVLGVNAIGEDGYIVFGNKNLVLDTTNGLGLWAYGMIMLDREDKNSRHKTYEKMKFIIEHGGNIIIFPEGYWNLDDNGLSDYRHGSDLHNSESWLIQDINIGVIRLSQETSCPIIPTILHYDEFKKKRCYSIKGLPFYVNKQDNIFDKKDELVSIMTNMYFTLMEKYSRYTRKELETSECNLKEQWIRLKKELISDCDIPSIGYHLNLENEKLIGKAKVLKPITTNEEVFEHLDYLNINKKNAFLLSKHFSGKKRK